VAVIHPLSPLGSAVGSLVSGACLATSELCNVEIKHLPPMMLIRTDEVVTHDNYAVTLLEVVTIFLIACKKPCFGDREP
jgi:hypothetical protein